TYQPSTKRCAAARRDPSRRRRGADPADRLANLRDVAAGGSICRRGVAVARREQAGGANRGSTRHEQGGSVRCRDEESAVTGPPELAGGAGRRKKEDPGP